MHEGILFRKNNFWRNDSCENLDNFSLIRLLYMHRWCLHGPINSYYSFWWNNLILCRYNVDTLNICMKEFGSQKIILTKWQLWELRQLFPYMAFVYAWIVPLWADQVLLQLLMEQFDTLPTQCRHIEHMHEGVYNFCLHRFYWNLLIKTKVFLFELYFAKFFHWLLLCGGYLISIAYWLFSFLKKNAGITISLLISLEN